MTMAILPAMFCKDTCGFPAQDAFPARHTGTFTPAPCRQRPISRLKGNR